MALSKCCIPRPYQLSAYSRHKSSWSMKHSRKLIKFAHLQKTNDKLGKMSSTEDGLKYIMARSVSRQDKPNPVLWLVTQVDKMVLPYPLAINCCAPQENSVFFSDIINPLLPKLVWSRWLEIGLVSFCMFLDLNFVLCVKASHLENPSIKATNSALTCT